MHPIHSAQSVGSGWSGPRDWAKTVRLRLPSGEKKGVFEGLDRFGRLQLKSAHGVELIDAGDLYFPNLLHDIAKPEAGTKRF